MQTDGQIISVKAVGSYPVPSMQAFYFKHGRQIKKYLCFFLYNFFFIVLVKHKSLHSATHSFTKDRDANEYSD